MKIQRTSSWETKTNNKIKVLNGSFFKNLYKIKHLHLWCKNTFEWFLTCYLNKLSHESHARYYARVLTLRGRSGVSTSFKSKYVSTQKSDVILKKYNFWALCVKRNRCETNLAFLKRSSSVKTALYEMFWRSFENQFMNLCQCIANVCIWK